MKNLVIVIASNRAQPNDQLFKTLADFAAHGTAIIHHTGTTDVALARNISLTLAHSVLKQKHHTMVLMVDDDMVFSADNVVSIIAEALKTQRATSACYVLASGALAANRKDGKWVTGLGFLAIPSTLLLSLGDSSEQFRFQGKNVIQFTESRITTNGEGVREWQGEDYVLCERLGGIDLLPVAVGHLKPKVLKADETYLKAFLEEQEQQ